MFKDGDPKGANAIPARATPSPKWQEAIKESGRRDDELRKNACPNKHTSTQVGLLSTAVSETPRGYLVATSLGAPRTHTGCTLRPKRAPEFRSNGLRVCLRADHGVAQSGNDLLPRRP